MIWGCMGSFSVITLQWYIWGYSLAFSSTGTSGFIGNLAHVGLRNVLGEPSPGSPLIPELLYSFCQLQFAATTGAIVTGAIAERGRLIPMMVFIYIWTTLVYCPIAYWAWNVNGWAFKYGVLDYAGGGPVEICSGVSALAYSMVLGKRQQKMMLNFRPHNVSLVVLGTIILWFGWLGFNGGSAFGAIIGLDGVSTGLINGGWLNHNWKQLYIQVAYVVACTAYSFVVSAGIAALVNVVPGLKLRASKEAELLGMDDDQLGEFAYDYVEVRRDYLAWTPAVGEMEMLHGVPVESQKMENEELRSRGIHGGGRLMEMRNMDGEIMPHMNGNGVDRLGSSLSTGSQEKTALVADDLRRR